MYEPFGSWKEGLAKLDVNLWETWRKFRCRRSLSYPLLNMQFMFTPSFDANMKITEFVYFVLSFNHDRNETDDSVSVVLCNSATNQPRYTLHVVDSKTAGKPHQKFAIFIVPEGRWVPPPFHIYFHPHSIHCKCSRSQSCNTLVLPFWNINQLFININLEVLVVQRLLGYLPRMRKGHGSSPNGGTCWDVVGVNFIILN